MGKGSNLEQIAALEEQQKKLNKKLMELRRKQEERNNIKYRRIGKLFVTEYTDVSVDDIPDTEEGAAAIVNQIMSGAEPQHARNIEQEIHNYFAKNTFGCLRTDDGDDYVEPFAFADLQVKTKSGEYQPVDLPDVLAKIFMGPRQGTK